jgi:hypothetical protein
LLNEGTIKNTYLLPLVGDLLDKLKGAQWFTKLDIRWGYHNVRIKEGDEWKAAFKTNRGLFEPTVMFFGLCNSPATFQAMMNEIFKDMIDEGWIEIYMDDILLHSKHLKEHQERTRRVLQRLQDNDLYLKAEKCKFDIQEVASPINCQWIRRNLLESKIGLPQPQSRPSDLSWDLETSTDDLLDISLTLPDPSTTSPRKIGNLNGLTVVREPLMRSKSSSLKHQYSSCRIL